MSPLPLPVTLALGQLPATPTPPDLRVKGQPVRNAFISDRTAGPKSQSLHAWGPSQVSHKQESGTIAAVVGCSAWCKSSAPLHKKPQ